jgi:hypothetical protein
MRQRNPDKGELHSSSSAHNLRSLLAHFTAGAHGWCRLERGCSRQPLRTTNAYLAQLSGAVDAPPVPTLATDAYPTIYFELQEMPFCQVHALNNAHGHQVLTGQQLMDHCLRLAERNSAWRQAYEPVVGNFSVAAINHWLFHNTDAKLVYQPWARLTGN